MLFPLPGGSCLENVPGCTAPLSGLSLSSGSELQDSPYWPDTDMNLWWCWTYQNPVILERVMIKNSLLSWANNLQQRTTPPHMTQVSLWMPLTFSLIRSDAASPNQMPFLCLINDELNSLAPCPVGMDKMSINVMCSSPYISLSLRAWTLA